MAVTAAGGVILQIMRDTPLLLYPQSLGYTEVAPCKNVTITYACITDKGVLGANQGTVYKKSYTRSSSYRLMKKNHHFCTQNQAKKVSDDVA